MLKMCQHLDTDKKSNTLDLRLRLVHKKTSWEAGLYFYIVYVLSYSKNRPE